MRYKLQQLGKPPLDIITNKAIVFSEDCKIMWVYGDNEENIVVTLDNKFKVTKDSEGYTVFIKSDEEEK